MNTNLFDLDEFLKFENSEINADEVTFNDSVAAVLEDIEKALDL